MEQPPRLSRQISAPSPPGRNDHPTDALSMRQSERIRLLSRTLAEKRCLNRDAWLRRLGVSLATLKRDLVFLRDRMDLPTRFDRDLGAWKLDPAQQAGGTRHELPGLWFDEEEMRALLTMQHLLDQLGAGGLLARHVEPLAQRLKRLLGAGTRHGPAELARRIRVQSVAARPVPLPCFQTVATALLGRRRLAIVYRGRSRDAATEREVSPQRLTHYRGNWYLLAWCHLRDGLRSFSLDVIDEAAALDTAAMEVGDAELDAGAGAAYGIFAGPVQRWATLRFSPGRARWIAAETWHPQQRGHFDEAGRYVLEVPYADPRELVLDVMRYVPEVEVLGPEELKAMVVEKLRQGLGRLTD